MYVPFLCVSVALQLNPYSGYAIGAVPYTFNILTIVS